MDMFGNLGQALRLVRELRGRNQVQVAREAGIGKSQLSKYESGRELPKLESLARILRVLDVGPLAFFYALKLIDRGARELDAGRGPADERLALELFLAEHPALRGDLEAAFARLLSDLLEVYRVACAQALGPWRHAAPGATAVEGDGV